MARNAEALKIRPWAVAGDRSTPEAEGMDRSIGWSVVYSQIGGETVKRSVVNQLLCELSSHFHEINTGGIPEWSAEIDYAHTAFVRRGASLFVSTADSGPATGTNIAPGEPGARWIEY